MIDWICLHAMQSGDQWWRFYFFLIVFDSIVWTTRLTLITSHAHNNNGAGWVASTATEIKTLERCVHREKGNRRCSRNRIGQIDFISADEVCPFFHSLNFNWTLISVPANAMDEILSIIIVMCKLICALHLSFRCLTDRPTEQHGLHFDLSFFTSKI